MVVSQTSCFCDKQCDKPIAKPSPILVYLVFRYFVMMQNDSLLWLVGWFIVGFATAVAINYLSS